MGLLLHAQAGHLVLDIRVQSDERVLVIVQTLLLRHSVELGDHVACLYAGAGRGQFGQNERKIGLLGRAETLCPAAATANSHGLPGVGHVRRSAAVDVRPAALNAGREDGSLELRRDRPVQPDGRVHVADTGRNGRNRDHGPAGRRRGIGGMPVIGQTADNQGRDQDAP